MPLDNKKIVIIVGVLLATSFLNFQINDYQNLTAQSGPGVIELWYRFLKPKTGQTSKIKEYPLDPTSIVLNKNPYFEKIEGKYFKIYYGLPKNASLSIWKYYNNFAQDILLDADREWEVCLDKLDCPLSEINENKKGNIILYGDADQYDIASESNGGRGCYDPNTKIIIINASGWSGGVRANVLPHELWHYALDYSCNVVNFPLAINEGLANLRQQREYGYFTQFVRDSEEVHDNIRRSRKYSIYELLSSSYPKFRNNFENKDFYNQGTSLVLFLRDRLGSEKDVVDFALNVGNRSRFFWNKKVLKKYGFNNHEDLTKQWLDWERQLIKEIDEEMPIVGEPVPIAPEPAMQEN